MFSEWRRFGQFRTDSSAREARSHLFSNFMRTGMNSISEPATCEYRTIPDRFYPYIDKLSRAFSLSDCQRLCDLEDKFVCRSLNFESMVRDCALSSDDMVSMQPSSEGLLPRPNSLYSEKGSCEQVSVQCNQQDMLLSVNFGSPFHGRVYAKGNPTSCYMVGTGQTTLLFAISLGTRCGTVVEGSGRYANEVVIQQHPVIVTNSDKTIKVICSFENLDRTVTLGALFPGASPGLDVTTRFQLPVTAIVTNTAPPPSLVMRVLDRTGRDAGVVGLGDELMLRIELREPASTLAIFARNLYARSKNGESLFLIDSTGCPTDPSIFPGLNLDARDRKTLFANFKAFRFPSTGLVNFEVQIRFCQDHCQPVRCANSMESFGRRKRDVSDEMSRDQPTSPTDEPSTTASGTADRSRAPTEPGLTHQSTPQPPNTANVTEVYGIFRIVTKAESPHANNKTHTSSLTNITNMHKSHNWMDGHYQTDFSSDLPKRERPISTRYHFSNNITTRLSTIRSPNPLRPVTTGPYKTQRPNTYTNQLHQFPNGPVIRSSYHQEYNPIIRPQDRPVNTNMSSSTMNGHNPNSAYYRPMMRTNYPKGRYFGHDPARMNTPQGRTDPGTTKGMRFSPSTTNGKPSTYGRTQWAHNRAVQGQSNMYRRPAQYNRYYAYNTKQTSNSTAKTSSRQSYPSSLTTPEMVISTMVPVPDELPLSLAIMVGEDTGVDISSWKAKPNVADSKEDSSLVCTSVTTIAATAVTLSLAHVVGLVSAYCCFRWHRKKQRKRILQKSMPLPPRNPATSRRQSGDELFYAKPEVSFRNVYGDYSSTS